MMLEKGVKCRKAAGMMILIQVIPICSKVRGNVWAKTKTEAKMQGRMTLWGGVERGDRLGALHNEHGTGKGRRSGIQG